jgi:hypothetical protein
MKPTYSNGMDTLHAHLMSGQRVYYPQPHYFTHEQLGTQCCTIFKMKQLMPLESLIEFQELDPEYITDTRRNSQTNFTGPAADRLVQEVVNRSWNKGKQNLSQSIMFKWPFTPFEEWVEQEINEFWMTAEWFQDPNLRRDISDYAFIISVHTPVQDKVKFDTAYGEAFVMTKLIHY